MKKIQKLLLGLKMLNETKPHYIKIDMDLIEKCEKLCEEIIEEFDRINLILRENGLFLHCFSL